jgi:hypothetical protein
MSVGLDTELRALVRVVCDLRVPEEGEAKYQVSRPECINILELDWLEDLVEAILLGVLTTFDLRKKTELDDPDEIEEWKKPAVTVGGWVERRKNHRLRIRTMVDDLFEKNLPPLEVPATVRAWKIQVADECANAILDRFHIRPASSGPWASYRRTMHDIAQNLQQALGYKDLFLITGRPSEAKTMEASIKDAYHTIQQLVQEIEEDGVFGPTG